MEGECRSCLFMGYSLHLQMPFNRTGISIWVTTIWVLLTLMREFLAVLLLQKMYVSHNLDVMDCLQIVNPGKPSLRLPSSNLVRSCVTKDPLYPVAAGTWYLRIVANSKQSHTLQTYNKHGSAHVSIIILKDKETRKSLMYKLLRRRHEREE